MSVSHLMSEYFGKKPIGDVISEGLPKEVPIEAKRVKWKVTQDGNALIRTYNFSTFSNLRLFIDQLLGMQERVNHHAQILIDGNDVKIKVSTKTLNRITEMDTEYAAEADNIYEETCGE